MATCVCGVKGGERYVILKTKNFSGLENGGHHGLEVFFFSFFQVLVWPDVVDCFRQALY